jgi:hypothetical protein
METNNHSKTNSNSIFQRLKFVHLTKQCVSVQVINTLTCYNSSTVPFSSP